MDFVLLLFRTVLAEATILPAELMPDKLENRDTTLKQENGMNDKLAAS